MRLKQSKICEIIQLYSIHCCAGTTVTSLLLGSHSDVSLIFPRGVHYNEALFIQPVYPAALYHARENFMRQGQLNPFYANDTARAIVYSHWRPFWNLSKPVLLEKSPMHCIVTPLLQYYFGAERSRFIIVLRHPFGPLKIAWARYAADKICRVEGWEAPCDCGERYLKDWLETQELIFNQLPMIKHVAVFHLELMSRGNTQGLLTYECYPAAH